MRTLIFVTIVSTLFLGCESNKDNLSQKASIEGKAASDATIKAENENFVQKSEAMEADLAARHRFFQATAGLYEGSLKAENQTYKIRITLVPTIAPYEIKRTRQLDEISADLNALAFNGQVIQWDEANPLAAVGCRISQVKPNLKAGTITIASEGCTSLYTLSITDEDTFKNPHPNLKPGDTARYLSQLLITGRLDSIRYIYGTLQPTTNASIFEFMAQKIKE